jgi:ubiquinone/menaquinone biosynthesis C-methylase UbiE/broad specificity phosphatase PhoE
MNEPTAADIQLPFIPRPPSRLTDAAPSTDDEAPHPTRLLLVCHGEGIHTRYHGLAASESGLTATGWEQASALSAWLRTHEEIDLIASAGQLRSRLTAQRIGQELNLPVTIFETLPTAPAQDLSSPPHIDTATDSAPTLPGADRDVDAPGSSSLAERPDTNVQGEAVDFNDYAAFCTSAVNALHDILAQHWGKTVAVVTNASSVAVLLRSFFGQHVLAIRVDYTGISELRFTGREWELLYVNRREHLPRPQLAAARQPPTMEPAKSAEDNLETVRRVFDRVAAQHAGNHQPPDDETMERFLRFAHFPENARLLEIGSGTGHIALALAQRGASEVVGVDVSPGMLEQAEYLRLSSVDSTTARRVSFRLASAHALPFDNQSFDVVVCRFLFHLIGKPASTLQEIRRVIKPSGLLILVDLLGDEDAVKRATQDAIEERRNPGHRAARSLQQYRRMLTEAGFSIEDEKSETESRELQEWLQEMAVDEAARDAIKEMMEASMETDAAGLSVRNQEDTILFNQRTLYLRAQKPE